MYLKGNLRKILLIKVETTPSSLGHILQISQVWEKEINCLNSGSNFLKELRHDILSHFFHSLNCGLSAGKPKSNGLLRKKKTKGFVLEQKGTRMAEHGGD